MIYYFVKSGIFILNFYVYEKNIEMVENRKLYEKCVRKTTG